MCTLIISLVLKDHRIKRRNGIAPSIFFAVYEVPQNKSIDATTGEPLVDLSRKQHLNTDFFKKMPRKFCSRSSQSATTLKVNLWPGQYCVIPSTLMPFQEGEFLLRIFTERRLCCYRDEIGEWISLDAYPADNYASSKVNETKRVSAVPKF